MLKWFSNGKAPITPAPYLVSRGFEQDFAPLLFLLKTFMTHDQTMSHIVNGAGTSRKVSEEEVRSRITEVSTSVLTAITPEYRKVLNCYFTDDAINELVVNFITEELVGEGVSLNTRHIYSNMSVSSSTDMQ